MPAEELPLAIACQKVLASMQAILNRTTENCQAQMKKYDELAEKQGHGLGEEADAEKEKQRHLALMNASEVKVVRFVREMLDPPDLERFKAKVVNEVRQDKVDEKADSVKPDELGVLPLGLGGKDAEGAIQIVGENQGYGVEESEKKAEVGSNPWAEENKEA